MLDVTKRQGAAPFDTARLDRLMDEAGIDVLLANSKPNVQYLLGGHRSFFFDTMDAIGVSRYLPIVVYAKGAPEKAGYFGHRMEGYQTALKPFWVAETNTKSSGTIDVVEAAADYLRRLGKPKRVGIELSFLPAASADVLRKAFPDSEFKDALFVLERLRARKTPEELEKLRLASDLVIDSMLAVFASHGVGSTKAEMAEALRREETARGLTFDYCLIAAGSSLNRAPSEQRWEKGDVLSVDSGGNYQGYIGDLARMGVAGEPDSGACRAVGRGGIDPAGRAQADPRRRRRRRDLRGGGSRAAQIEAAQSHRLSRSRHGPRQPRSAAPHQCRAGSLRQLRCEKAARCRHGDFGGNHAAASAPRLHQARGYGRRDGERLRGLWRSRPRVEPRRRRGLIPAPPAQTSGSPNQSLTAAQPTLWPWL